MKPTYFGAYVRLSYSGPVSHPDITVQVFSPVSDGWHSVWTFTHDSEHPISSAREYASELAYAMLRGVA